MSRKLIVGLFLVATTVLLAGAGGAVAAGGPSADAPGNATADGGEAWRLTNTETGEAYTVPADVPLASADLPAGEYRAVLATDGGEDRIVRTVTVDGVRAASHDTDLEVSVVTGREYEGSYAVGEMVQVWAGLRNETTGEYVANERVTVAIQRADGTVDNLTGTTDQYGSVNVAYDTSGKPTGRYDIDAVYVDGREYYAYGDFVVGPRTDLEPPELVGFVGREYAAALRVTSGFEPVAGVERSVEVVRPDGGTVTRTATTDDAGVATFSFTPSQTGAYEFRIDEPGNSYEELNVGTGIAHVLVEGEEYADPEPGRSVAISGRAVGPNGPLANERLTVELVNTTDWDDEQVAATLTATTDGQGVFTATWDAPDEVPDATYSLDYDIRLSDSAGGHVAVRGARSFDVREERLGGGSAVDLDVREVDYRPVAPGGQKRLLVTVTRDGSPVEDAAVTLESRLDYDNVAVDRQTVRTNATGEARVSVSVPADAPVPGDFQIEATTTVGGTTDTDWEYVSIEDVEVDLEYPDGYGAAPGQESTVTYEVTEPGTDVPVPGATVSHLAFNEAFETGVFGSAVGTTGSDGTATLRTAVGPDARGRVGYSFAVPGESSGWYSEPVASYEATLEGIDDDNTHARGERVTLSFSSTSSADTSGVVVVRTWYDRVDDEVPLVQRVDAGEQASFTVPTSAPDGTWFQVRAFTMDANGDAAVDYDYIRVEGGGPVDREPTVAVSDARVGLDETATVPVTVDRVPDGLQTVELTVSLDDTDTAHLTGAAAGEVGGFQVASQSDAAVTVRAADLSESIDAGDGPVTLANVTVAGDAEGQASLSVRVSEFVDDTGADVAVRTAGGTLTVTDSPFSGTVGGGEGPPTDPDGDGQFEDVDGDGTADFEDAVTLAFVDTTALTAQQVDALDFDEDGDLDFDDAIELAFQV